MNEELLFNFMVWLITIGLVMIGNSWIQDAMRSGIFGLSPKTMFYIFNALFGYTLALFLAVYYLI